MATTAPRYLALAFEGETITDSKVAPEEHASATAANTWLTKLPGGSEKWTLYCQAGQMVALVTDDPNTPKLFRRREDPPSLSVEEQIFAAGEAHRK